MIDENTSVLDTFRLSNELLSGGVANVWRVMAHKGLIEIHFSDLCTLLKDRHAESAFASAEASGSARSREVMDKLLAHPMLDGGRMLAESEAVLVSLIGGPDLTMAEVNRVMEHINGKCAKAQIIMGAGIDEAFRDRLTVTIVAARQTESLPARAGIDESLHADAAQPRENMDDRLVDRPEVPRSGSRFVPPPPSLSPDKMEQIAARQTGSRPRRASSKLRQTTLPLEIISKGRFDKSEPTIYKGEDLDVPTYIRRGIALN
jgi:cell division protein FtsZ